MAAAITKHYPDAEDKLDAFLDAVQNPKTKLPEKHSLKLYDRQRYKFDGGYKDYGAFILPQVEVDKLVAGLKQQILEILGPEKEGIK